MVVSTIQNTGKASAALIRPPATVTLAAPSRSEIRPPAISTRISTAAANSVPVSITELSMPSVLVP